MPFPDAGDRQAYRQGDANRRPRVRGHQRHQDESSSHEKAHPQERSIKMQSGGDIAKSEHQKDHRVELFRRHSASRAEQNGYLTDSNL